MVLLRGWSLCEAHCVWAQTILLVVLAHTSILSITMMIMIEKHTIITVLKTKMKSRMSVAVKKSQTRCCSFASFDEMLPSSVRCVTLQLSTALYSWFVLFCFVFPVACMYILQKGGRASTVMYQTKALMTWIGDWKYRAMSFLSRFSQSTRRF